MSAGWVRTPEMFTSIFMRVALTRNAVREDNERR
jgi:hypothetical protein